MEKICRGPRIFLGAYELGWRYVEYTRTAVCYAQGNFTFKELPSGTYFVVAPVIWTVGNAFIPEGGFLMQRVELAQGESRRIVMAP